MKSSLVEQMQELPSAIALSTDLLAGQWINTNPSPVFIRDLQLEPSEGQLRMRVSGAVPRSPADWGQSQARIFAENSASAEAMAFSAVFDLEDIEVRVQGYVVKGVLVIVSFTRVKDSGNGSSCFGKEFFYRIS